MSCGTRASVDSRRRNETLTRRRVYNANAELKERATEATPPSLYRYFVYACARFCTCVRNAHARRGAGVSDGGYSIVDCEYSGLYSEWNNYMYCCTYRLIVNKYNFWR